MIRTIRDHTLYLDPLGQGTIVVDLGANAGTFSLEMADRFGCQCVAVEPSPVLFESIPDHPKIRVLNVAVAAEEGTMNFHIRADPLGSTLFPEEGATYVDVIPVRVQTLESIAEELELGRIDLLKMDIEGAEVDVLASCSERFLKGIGQISIEFHDFNGVVSEAAVRRCVDRLRGYGFLVYKKSWDNWCDVLLVNPSVVHISRLRFLWHRHVVRLAAGVRRRMGF